MKRRSWLGMAATWLPGCRRRQTPPARQAEGPPPAIPWRPLDTSWEHVMGGELGFPSPGVLRLGWGEGLSAIRWTGPAPALPFEIELEARRMDGTDFFCGLTFPARASGECLTWIVGGWGGSLVGISSIDGKDASENDTGSHRRFERERWYRLHLRRQGELLEAAIDGQNAIRIDTTGRELDLRPGPISSCAPFGLATWQTTAEFRNLRWRPLAA